MDVLEYSICTLTETWLKPDVLLYEFFNNNLFHVFRYNRIDRLGGGVLIAINAR